MSIGMPLPPRRSSWSSGRSLALVLTAALGTLIPSCSSPEGSVTIQGAGATFPAPLYKRWFLEYYKLHPEVRVNYQGIGSSAGIRKFTEGLTAFGASDAGLNKDEAALFKKERGSDALLLPMTAGSIVLCYNVPEVSAPLRLSRKAYLRIFLGEITSWNDKAIAETNPGVELPDTDITVVRRAEGSGTTYAFTNHLSAVGKAVGIPWTPGVGKAITWPKPEMIGGRGNPGVAALIQQTPGAIGYLESAYAKLAKLPTALLQNKAGAYVQATPKSGEAALEGAKVPDDFRIEIPDPAGKKAYPIVTYTWVVCYQDYTAFGGDPAVGETLKQVLRFCLTDGQRYSTELGYIPLPPGVVEPALRAVAGIKTSTGTGR
jgi:phosphate transport system substrate-binding protein